MSKELVTKWLIPTLIAISGFVARGYVGYTDNDKSTTSRIVAVETVQGEASKRFDRLENKVDRIDDKLDEILRRIDLDSLGRR